MAQSNDMNNDETNCSDKHKPNAMGTQSIRNREKLKHVLTCFVRISVASLGIHHSKELKCSIDATRIAAPINQKQRQNIGGNAETLNITINILNSNKKDSTLTEG